MAALRDYRKYVFGRDRTAELRAPELVPCRSDLQPLALPLSRLELEATCPRDYDSAHAAAEAAAVPAAASL